MWLLWTVVTVMTMVVVAESAPGVTMQGYRYAGDEGDGVCAFEVLVGIDVVSPIE